MADKAMILAAWMFALALPASAHLYPILPVQVSLRVEPDRVVADVEAESTYWIEEILAFNPLPPSDWTSGTLQRAEDYTEAHLRLSADGARLKGRLTEAAYVQRPWQINEQGRILLRMVYPPVRPGAKLSGEIDFYEEYRQEMLGSRHGQPLPDVQEYKTLLQAGSHWFALKPGASSFEIPDALARPGPAGRALIAFAAGWRALLQTASAWPALAALALLLAPTPPSRRRAAVGVLALASGLAAARPVPGSAVWIAGLAAAAAAGGWLGQAASWGLAAGSLAALGWFWGAQALPWLPAAAPSAGLRAASAAGTMAAAALTLAAGFFIVLAQRRHFSSLSESRSGEIFERRRRLAATVLLLVCGYGLSQNIAR